MRVRALGTAAGGGFPQWNCSCERCDAGRSGGASPRTHASLAITADGADWCLVNATPDVRFQIEATPELHPRGPGRGTPISAVLLTDAELDHTLGLLQLREGSAFEVLGSASVLGALDDGLPIRRLLSSYAPVAWRSVPLRSPVALSADLAVEALGVGAKRPRYAARAGSGDDWVLALKFTDLRSGGVVAYAPGISAWSDDLEDWLGSADCVFFDGTFWADDDMSHAGAGSRSAADMGHLPISGIGGSAQRLAAAAYGRKVYSHINNTNPILLESSREQLYLRELGLEVGYDGMEIEV